MSPASWGLVAAWLVLVLWGFLVALGNGRARRLERRAWERDQELVDQRGGRP